MSAAHPFIKMILRPVALVPITVDSVFEVDKGTVAAVVFKNQGTATVEMWNGNFTLDSKDSITFNVTDDISGIELTNIPIKFDISTGAVKKLQIILLKQSPC